MYNKYRRFSLTLLVSLTLIPAAHSSDFPDEAPAPSPAPVYTNSSYTRAQVVQILDQYFDALFAKHRFYSTDATNFELFKNNTILTLLHNRITFEPDQINQLKENICSVSLTFIETNARDYTLQALNRNQHLIPDTYTTRDRITTTITNEVSRIITSNNSIGKLHNYFGTNLQNKINELVSAEIRKLS